jgi:hypothetical protein
MPVEKGTKDIIVSKPAKRIVDLVLSEWLLDSLTFIKRSLYFLARRSR